MLRALGSCAFGLLVAHLSIGAAHGQLPPLQAATAPEILDDIRSGSARVTVVNFWATWCVPCREEFPDYLRFGNEFQDEGVRMIFVSTDYADNIPAARLFLAEYGVTDTTYVRSGNDRDFIDGFYDQWSGGLPATLLYGPNGRLIDFWEGAASYETLKTRVNSVMGRLQ